jgi:hypothetical protein
MPVANLSRVVTRRPDRGDGLRRAEGVASLVVISMYEHALAVVLLHGSQIFETFSRSSALIAGIGNSNGATIQARSLLVNKGAEK